MTHPANTHNIQPGDIVWGMMVQGVQSTGVLIGSPAAMLSTTTAFIGFNLIPAEAITRRGVREGDRVRRKVPAGGPGEVLAVRNDVAWIMWDGCTYPGTEFVSSLTRIDTGITP